jgi:hypothetical protein
VIIFWKYNKDLIKSYVGEYYENFWDIFFFYVFLALFHFLSLFVTHVILLNFFNLMLIIHDQGY